MVLEYFTLKKGARGFGKPQEEHVVKTPILNEEEEQFLERITSEGTTTPVRVTDAQTALMDGANKIPLPASPHEETEKKEKIALPSQKHSVLQEKRQKYMSNISSLVRGMNKQKSKEEKVETANMEKSHKDHNEEMKDQSGRLSEEKQEEDDLTQVLDQLNLAAMNNRVFSFSKESQELLDKFKLVLKDLVNGVPTAYDDLEKLLTNSEGQIQRLYGGLPPFLQTLIKGLPSKMTAALGPEILAAAAEKPGADAAKLRPDSALDNEDGGHKRTKTPTLKRLVSQQGAVASMLRSILHFLKLRFPAFVTGTNVLMSLAVFVLLFVFWYCHKRGKETRLSREHLSAEASESQLESSKIEFDQTDQTESAASVKRLDASAEKGDVVLPSVLDLPEPASVPLPDNDTMAKEKVI